ncbi:MAG: uL13 family ribosomal protein [Enterobacteriaceae bacterium]
MRGKHKAEYTPHVDTGDYIIVLNADKVAVTGNKRTGQSVLSPHRPHRWYQTRTFEEMIARRPERVLEIGLKACCQRPWSLCSVTESLRWQQQPRGTATASSRHLIGIIGNG